jgi:hypothetical protein
MRSVLTLFLMIFGQLHYLSGQDLNIAGLVSEKLGKTLQKSGVILNSSSTGTSINLDGNYRLSVSYRSILFSAFKGHLTRELTVNNEPQISIIPESSLIRLSVDFVTVLFIKPESKSLNYTVQTAIAELHSNVHEFNLAKSLPAKVGGLDLATTEHGVGGVSRIILTGNRSKSVSNETNYILDCLSGFSLNSLKSQSKILHG